MTPSEIFPMIVVLSPLVFVLLIILLTKAPKAGVWIVPGLILLLLFGFLFPPMSPALPKFPLMVIWSAFVFVLLIILLSKAPKAGVGLIIGIVVLGLLGLFLWPMAAHRRVAHAPAPRATLVVPAPRLPPIPTPPQPTMRSPIWSQGVEAEFDADVYPSRLVAVRALGSRIDRLIRELPLDVNSPPQIVLFQQDQDRDLIAELRNRIQKVLPAATCTVETEQRNVQPTEAMVTLALTDINMERAPWAKSDEVKAADGRIKVHVFAAGQGSSIEARFIDKPWIADFAAFTSTRPEQHFIVTRSKDTCTSESEAHQQALNDAQARLTDALGRSTQWKVGKLPQPEITGTDVLQGGFIVDRFTQSFEGSVGRIWRQALLIDVSGPKLTHLADQKAREFRSMRMSWARMGFSVIGVVVLIAVIYFFLNMATMGYYEWSLRIAGVVLAIVAIISILMIVR